jgi:HEAT repeats
MNAGTGSETGREQEPSVVGVRVRPFWSIVLYALLVGAAGLALYAERAPNLDPALVRAGPWLFLVFALGFSIYRIALVAAKRYSPFKAFIQIFLAALFFLTLLFPHAPQATPQQGAELLGHGDARVRAVAAEVIGWRNDQTRAHSLVPLLNDANPDVRTAAHDALVRLNGGVDLSASDEKAWGARFP